MLNQTILVGRVVRDIEVKELENGKKVSNITIAVPRSYKNEEGVYDTDFIDCVLWEGIAENAAEYLRKGDLVGIKGRLQTTNYETETGEKRKATEVIAEKLTFLSSRKQNESEE